MGLKLVTVETVRERIYLPHVDGVSVAIDEALQAATEILEAELRTTFALETRTDTFYIEQSTLRGQRHMTKLRLAKGILTDPTNLTVQIGATFRTFLDGTPTDLRGGDHDTAGGGTGSEPPDEFVQIDSERGIVILQDAQIISEYAQVVYEAGIDVSGDDANLFLETGAKSTPTWLKELAVLQTMQQLEQNKVLGRLVSDTERGAQFGEDLTNRLATMLDRHMRYEPDALNAILFT